MHNLIVASQNMWRPAQWGSPDNSHYFTLMVPAVLHCNPGDAINAAASSSGSQVAMDNGSTTTLFAFQLTPY
jgi:hypothetical protein